MKKHILILGGSLMQKPAVLAARALGCRITLVDANPQALCRSLCDSFEHIDLKDSGKIAAFARRLYDTEGLNAVFTAGTDFSYAVSLAAQACSFPAHSPQAAKNASDKLLMRSCFEKNGVPSPRFVQADSRTSVLSDGKLREFLHSCRLDFPLVVKPCDNMGARGCRLVHSLSELSYALKDAVAYSRTGRAVIEEYMDGPEFSIDALVFNGELTVTGFADRHIFFPPYFIEMGHTVPSSVTEEKRTVLFETFAAGVRALDLTYGAAKADIKLTAKGPMVGEIAARLSGGYMSGWTYPYASDAELTREAVLLALGESPAGLLGSRMQLGCSDKDLRIFEVPCKRSCAERAWISVPGIISETLFFDEARHLAGIKDFFPRVKKNERAVFPVNNVEKAGNVIAVASDHVQAVRYASEAVKTVFLRLQSGNSETERFLRQPLDTAFPPSAFRLTEEAITQLERFEENEVQNCTGKLVLPSFLLEYADLTDWNGRSLRETVDVYNKLCGTTYCRKGKKFWHYLLRGGLQGAVFYSDTESKECR